jgi:GT2 family glycosyltransferase
VNPRLSIVIPTLGRPILVQTLQSLIRAQDFGEIEVIVAGAIEHPEVLREVQGMIAEHPQIIHLPVTFAVGDSSEKKNAGARQARSDVVVFLDDDVVVAPEWIRKISAPFDDPSVAVVSGPSLVPPDANAFARLAGLALSSPAAGYVMHRYRRDDPRPFPITWSKIIGCNMAYRKRVWEAIGGFPAEFWPGEEMIAAFRVQKAGHVLMFSPDAWVYHYPRQSPGRFWKQIHGYGATRVRLMRAGVEFEPTTLVPALWVASLAALIPLALFCTLCRWLLALDLLFYFLADAWITWGVLRETRRLSDVRIFLLVPVMHLSYGLASWVEFLRPNKDLSERPVRAGASTTAGSNSRVESFKR